MMAAQNLTSDSKATRVIASSSFHMDQIDYTGFEGEQDDNFHLGHIAVDDISYTMVQQPDGGTGGAGLSKVPRPW